MAVNILCPKCGSEQVLKCPECPSVGVAAVAVNSHELTSEAFRGFLDFVKEEKLTKKEIMSELNERIKTFAKLASK